MKTKIVTKQKTQLVTKLKKNQLSQNSKYLIVTVVIVTIVTVAIVTEVIVIYISKNNLTPQQPMRCSQGSFLQFLQCFILISVKREFVQSLHKTTQPK